MNLPAAFADIAARVAAVTGAPFDAGRLVTYTAPVMKGGSIVTPAQPIYRGCRAQFDVVTDAMRQEAGFTDKDVRIIVLAATIQGGGAIGTDERLEMTEGRNAGAWLIQSVTGDPAGIGFVLRARPA